MFVICLLFAYTKLVDLHVNLLTMCVSHKCIVNTQCKFSVYGNSISKGPLSKIKGVSDLICNLIAEA